jgi:hypothetical protein
MRFWIHSHELRCQSSVGVYSPYCPRNHPGQPLTRILVLSARCHVDDSAESQRRTTRGHRTYERNGSLASGALLKATCPLV